MSVEKNQVFKVGGKVKILPTIRSIYPKFPYVGVVGRVCTVTNNVVSIGVEFLHPHWYLHDCGGVAKQNSGWYCFRSHLELIPDDNIPDIWDYIK